MSTAVTMVRKTQIHCVICAWGGAFCSELQTLTLAPALQSCSYKTLTDRARPYRTIDDIYGATWRGALRVSEHKLHNQHMETSGNSCWSVNKKVNYFVLV